MFAVQTKQLSSKSIKLISNLFKKNIFFAFLIENTNQNGFIRIEMEMREEKKVNDVS